MLPFDMAVSTAEPAARATPCPRIHAPRAVAEHLDCSYCYGRAAAVATGDRKRFCDYDPAHDPVVFGFPHGASRRAG